MTGCRCPAQETWPGIWSADLRRLDTALERNAAEIDEALTAHGTSVTEIRGVGPVLAAKIVGHTSAVDRFPTRHHYASYCGTAPIEASSGEQRRHRLLPGREPSTQPCPAPGRRLPDPHQRARPGLLPAQTRRGQDPGRSPASTETPTQRHDLPPPRPRSTSEPLDIQRRYICQAAALGGSGAAGSWLAVRVR